MRSYKMNTAATYILSGKSPGELSRRTDRSISNNQVQIQTSIMSPLVRSSFMSLMYSATQCYNLCILGAFHITPPLTTFVLEFTLQHYVKR